MGKVSKKALEKHNVSLSPALADFIQKTCSLRLVDLPSHLASLPTRWPFPRGDLYNWIEALDHFDDILQRFNEKYGLVNGPQTQKFGIKLLEEDSPGISEEQLQQKGFGSEGDRELIEAILTFSRLLLDKCGNRALYSSTDRLNELFNTTSLSLLHSALRVTTFLATRYAERSTNPPLPHSSFYDFDQEKLHRLAGPLTPPVSLTSKRGPGSPTKSMKSKDRLVQPGKLRRSSTSVNPNDFRSMMRTGPATNGSGKAKAVTHDSDWQQWANIKVVWSAQAPGPPSQSTTDQQSLSSDVPPTPTPVRRQSSMLSRTPTSASNLDAAAPTTPVVAPEKPGLHTVELSASDLSKTTAEEVLRQLPEDVPQSTRYELLHKLRVAYGLLTSLASRRLLLQIRLLAVAILAYIYDEHDFPQKLFGVDASLSARQQLIHQIVSLLQDNKAQENIELNLQTLAMETISVLGRQRVFSNEIMAALAPNSSHGLLLILTQRGLTDMKCDGDETDNAVGDEWREAVFSLCSAFMVPGIHPVRSSESLFHPSLVAAYASGLKIMSNKALRVHLRILEFMKTFFHHFKDGLAVLSANHGFEAACELLDNLSQSALGLLHQGGGIRQEYKTKVTDYQIPYMHQQAIRSMIDLVNDVISHQGGHAERILRNLVDSQALLNGFHLVLSNIEAFGAHTWSEVVKAIVGFLHNEPTSYTIISEAGITKTLLGMVSSSPQQPLSGAGRHVMANPSETLLTIPPVADAIVNLSQAFGAICLTNAGFEYFKSSGALERFFEIFESPAHVKVIRDANTLALLGSTFDELVRHHLPLKESVLSNVIIMVARVRWICQSCTFRNGSGPKLWLPDHAGNSSVSGGINALAMEIVPQSQSGTTDYKPLKLPDGSTLQANSPSSDIEASVGSTATETDAHGLTAVDYARPAICFLMNFFENQGMCLAFMEAGACDLVLDLATLPSLPPTEQTFGHTNAITHELTNLIHMMAETKPHLVLPAIIDRAAYACEVLQDFTQYHPQDTDCFFAPFVRSSQNEEVMDIETSASFDATNRGTQFAKGLTTALLLVQILGELFNIPIYSTRSSTNTLFSQVNIADMLAGLCRSLGSLSAACYREEIALQRVMPAAWLPGTKPGNFTTGDDDMDKILHLNDSSSNSIDDSTRGQTESSSDDSNESLKTDKQTPAYKNAQTLRYLLIEMPGHIMEFFTRLGRGIAGKRRMETFAKQKTALVAEALADSYIAQLQPHFLSIEAPTEDNAKKTRFDYLSVALSNVRGSLSDDSPLGPCTSRQAFVVDSFRKAGGLKILTRIGTEFFEELALCKYSQSVFSANAGLKICLDILDDLTSAKNIVDANQTTHLRNMDPSRPFYFNPSQLLLELRMEALPLTRLVWDSDYADQASNDVVQKLVLILKHVFNGDHESEASSTTANHPNVQTHNKRKYIIDLHKVISLKEKGYPEDLIREALYRCNVHHTAPFTAAEEYCKAVQDNTRRRRLPIPKEEADSNSTPGTSSIRSPTNAPFNSAAPAAMFSGGAGGIEATLAEVVGSINDNDLDDIDDGEDDDEDNDITAPNTGSVAHGASAMNISNILNQPLPDNAGAAANGQGLQSLYSVETIDAERESVREELPERCNNILNNHHNLTFELSELLMSASKKLSEDTAKSYWKTTSDLLVSSLLSMQAEDDMTETLGKKIAAAAHLAALLIQNDEVFKTTMNVFRDAFDGLLSFLRLSSIPGRNGEEPSAPWVAPVLLIFERMLSYDAEPATLVDWTPPTELDPVREGRLTYHDVFTLDEKQELFTIIIALLSRIGKDKPMALSVIRVLVILTRHREIATMQGQRGNLQRLFLMVKQMGNAAQGRLQSNAFMLVLRHIIEDAETIKQIMCSEIVASFTGRSSTRQLDLTSFVRDNSHLALRSPEVFVEAANEKIKFSAYISQPGNQGLVLRVDDTEKAVPDDQISPQAAQEEPASINQPTTSIEAPTSEDKSKVTELKPPVVEHPDGVIHFLLSELLAYKDVDDKESPSSTIAKPQSTGDSFTDESLGVQSSSASGSYDTPQTSSDKQDKPKFKADDHPIFLYRCFLLQCLTELLYSYNRTKIEFINFSRKADPAAVTPSKPRSGVLNYVLNALVCSGYVDKDSSIACKKKMITSEWAVKVVVALCTKTGEAGLVGPAQRYSSHSQVDDQDSEPDLTFVRRFTLEHVIKAFKDSTTSAESLQSKYGRLLCFGDLFHKMLTKPAGPEGSAGSHNNSYKMLGRMMFEKNLVTVLTASLADIDLSFSSAKKVIKFILRPLQELTSLAVQWSLESPDAITSAMSNDVDDIISSASSVSEMNDGREETPDLFRNSALGILDPGRQDESETSEDDEEDEEMYDEEYGDEMDYDAGPNDGEVVSDEDIDDDLEDAGPIEGMPGDHPMDIEFVMDDPLNMESGSDDDDDDDDDSDEDDDDDDENADFEIEMDDDGEINGDNENDSLDDDVEVDDGWEDEDDEDDDQDDGEDDGAEVTFEGEDLPMPVDIGAHHGTHTELNNLLRVLGEQDLHANGPLDGTVPSQMIIEADQNSDHDDEEEEDDGDDGENMDENDGLEYDDGFNAMIGGPDEIGGGQWGWDEPPPTMFRRHRQSGGLGRGHLPFPGSRRIPGMDPDFHDHVMGGRHHRHAPPARAGVDDGTNPLLQRPDSSRGPRPNAGQPFSVTVMTDNGIPGMPGLPGAGGNMISMHIPGGQGMQLEGGNIGHMGGHGAVLDALLNAINTNSRGMFGGGFPPEGLRFSLSGPGDIREMMRSYAPPGHHHSRPTRDESGRVPTFVPMLTSNRWQEETRMLYGNTYIDKVQRIQVHLLSMLVPLAQEEEKIRQKKQEEEDERREQEAKELEQQRVEEERLDREREEHEAAEKAIAEEKARAEAEAAAAVASVTEATQDPSTLVEDSSEPMEGVQTDNGQVETSNTTSADEVAEPQRVYTTIRGRQLDITGLDIDIEYLEAIPEEMREEVIMAQYTSRRGEAAAQDDNGVNNDASTIDPDFLDALPEDIREEIRQQEAHMTRRREREAARRPQVTGGAQAEDMDNDNFLATLDPALRRAILAEQPPEVLSTLDPRHAAEGRAHQRGLFFHRMAEGRDQRDDRARRDQGQKEKRQVVQFIDKAGVATLLRLMFLPQQGSLRQHLWQILGNVCGNRQTRFELINLLLQILKEGSTDVSAVEKSLANLNIRARASGSQKTPQPLKRTLSMQAPAGLSAEITPMVVVQQCLAALQALCKLGFHVRTIFLREQDAGMIKATKKGKGKENKATKYPINDLIGLLDRRLIMDSSGSLQALSEVLSSVTQPLKMLVQKDSEQQKGSEQGTQISEATIQDVTRTTEAAESEHQSTSGDDTRMTEAPPTATATVDPAASTVVEQSEGKIDNSEEDAAKEDESKKKQPFEPPTISEHNLQLITSVFVAPECHNETFHSILATLSSLSCIPGTSAVFSKELIHHVQILSQAISADLDELLPLIREAQSTSDLQGITSGKFSAGGSDQIKLLRVLQALDFLTAPKNDGDDESATVRSILNSSYDTLSLGPLWHKLSECLTAVREKGDTIGFANILLPLIESLMVVCKNTPLKDAPVAGDAQEAIVSPKPEGMNDLEELFFNFTTEHRKILNDIVRQNPKLMQGEGNFSLLVKNSKVLDFDNKRNYFTKQIHSRNHQQRHVQPPLQLSVRRSNVFLDSYKNLYYKSAEEMKHGKLNIRFNGEEGVDAGGVTREWFQVLARSMFDPNYALFQPVASDRTTFHPSAISGVNEEHLQYFKFIGRIIGKALHEGRVLDCHFSRAVYKRILGKSPNLKDLESNDVDYYKSLVWILENDITDILTEEFCVIENEFGEEKIIDLIPDGRNITVTQDNKREYVQKLVEYRLTESVKDQLDHFLHGFHDIIPAELVAIFNEQELELLISGLPEVDVDDWKANTEYHNYSPSSPQIVWFWRIVRGMTNEERAKLLQFITGTSKVPLNGFKELEGVSGLTRFNIHKDPSTNRLPTSHTCFNQLDLPTYDSFEVMKQQITTAISLGADYFGFA